MIKNIELAYNEKDVENVYRSLFLKHFKNCEITSPFGVDGLLVSGNIHMLMEFKHLENFKSSATQAKILIQVVYYLKKFLTSGQKIPHIIFIGDMNECFILHTNDIIKYVDSDIDWSVAPSESGKVNPDIVIAIANDSDIKPFIYDISADFDFSVVCDKIKDLTDNVQKLVPISDHNINTIFDYFSKNVLDKKHKLSANEEANLFINILINPNENYLHPKKKNTLVSKSFGDISVNSKQFDSFFAHFKSEYSPKEKEMMTGIVDRLVTDTVRRRKGEFFTPTIWVDEAHKYITNTFGEDWKDKYVVWDPAWGTGNLTRDYKFKELYCSTIEQSDIDTANQMNYNPEAVKFQYDFLNDGIVDGQIDIINDPKLPQGLKDAILQGKEIIVFMNPPYAKATPNKGINGTGISDTKIGSEMKNKNLGIPSSQLGNQFLYRTLKFKYINENINVLVFNPSNYLTGDSVKKFRKIFLSSFGFSNAFMFNANHFSDTSDNWAIMFIIWESNINDIKNDFNLDVLGINSFTINKVGNKTLHNLDNHIKANSFFIKERNSDMMPPIKSFITIDSDKLKNGNINAIGYINNHSNNLQQQNVIFIASSVISTNGNKSITIENFYKVISLFAARKIVYRDWINWGDEYELPNERHPYYQQFQYDSIIYSLFNSKSQQSSLRQVDYKDTLWDIKNNFFWMSREEMMTLAENNNFDQMYQDARTDTDRFVYTKLFGEERIYDMLSPDARQVLDMATELMRKTMNMRILMSDEHPEYHLQSWDAGYAQMKLVWKQYFKEEFKAFRDAYKELENRMRPLVYTLGFLKGDNIQVEN